MFHGIEFNMQFAFFLRQYPEVISSLLSLHRFWSKSYTVQIDITPKNNAFRFIQHHSRAHSPSESDRALTSYFTTFRPFIQFSHSLCEYKMHHNARARLPEVAVGIE